MALNEVNVPIGSAWRDLLAKGRVAAQGLPSTVGSGLNYLWENRGAGLPWNLAEQAARELQVGTESVPGTSIPNITFGKRQPTVGVRGLPPPRDQGFTPRPAPPDSGFVPRPSSAVPLGGTEGGPSGYGGRFLSEVGPGMWKVDRTGQSPLYTNQMDVANQAAGEESSIQAEEAYRTMPAPPSAEAEIAATPTQTAPSLPSPSPAEGGEIRGRGVDWKRIAAAAGPVLGQLSNALSRPGSDRPYAQMGWDEEQAQRRGEALAQQKLALEEQQGKDRIAAMDREIQARMEMGQQEAAQRLQAIREEMIARAELQRQEMEARYGGTVSPEIAAAMGVPPGTSLREAELLSKVKESQAEAQQRAAYQKYLELQGGNLTADNLRQGIEARIRAIQANPVYAYSPEGQHEMAELSKQLTPGLTVSPLPPPPAAPPAPPPEPGLLERGWNAAKGLFGYGDEAAAPAAPVPVGPPPLPPEVLQVIAPLPKNARTIVEGILREHMNDPQSMKQALKQVIDKAPPEDREIVIKVLGPIVARF